MYPTLNPFITRHFGVPGDYAAGFHTGTDFGWRRPVELIRNAFRGRVVRVGHNDPAYGTFVVVKCVTLRHGTLYAWYCHLDKEFVREGQYLKSGAQIGHMGTTGNASGRHLHLEVRRAGNRYGVDAINPDVLLKARTVSRTLKRQGWK